MLKERVQSLRRVCADLVAGPGVLIADIPGFFNGLRKRLRIFPEDFPTPLITAGT
jgi:hypothetical protein